MRKLYSIPLYSGKNGNNGFGTVIFPSPKPFGSNRASTFSFFTSNDARIDLLEFGING